MCSTDVQTAPIRGASASPDPLLGLRGGSSRVALRATQRMRETTLRPDKTKKVKAGYHSTVDAQIVFPRIGAQRLRMARRKDMAPKTRPCSEEDTARDAMMLRHVSKTVSRPVH